MTSIIAQKLYKLLVFLLSIKAIFLPNVLVALENSNECLVAISKYEAKYNIPKGLLKAISNTESNFNPYALNDGVRSYNHKSKTEALTSINSFIENEKYNFDVGCMQLNYKWHGKYFSSIDEMLDVNGNVRYAAAYIYSLYKTHGSWHKAVRFYHSYNPKYYRKYSKKIATAWIKE